MIFQHIFIPKLTNKLFPSQLKNCNSGLTGTKQLTRQHTHTQKHTNTAAYYCSTRELNCLQDTLESLMTQGVYVCVCGCVNCFFISAFYLHTVFLCFCFFPCNCFTSTCYVFDLKSICKSTGACHVCMNVCLSVCVDQ